MSAVLARDPLSALVAEIDDLRARVAALEAQQAAPADREIAQLLPVVVGLFGSELFVVRELRACLPSAHRRSARTLGRLLSQAAAASDVHRYRVTKEGREHGAVLWRIRVVTDA